SIDSSLVDEWESAGGSDAEASAVTTAAPSTSESVVEDRRGLIVLIRNAMFRRVQLMDLEDADTLGELDKAWGYGVHEWNDVLDDYYDEHEYVGIDAKARSGDLFILDDSLEKSEHSWKVRQIIDDSDGDHNWAITGVVDLDTTQDEGEVVFFDYQVSHV
ncbi:DEAD/DEAH box helicase, partial [Bifidobacteriaceae bacterium WP022]